MPSLAVRGVLLVKFRLQLALVLIAGLGACSQGGGGGAVGPLGAPVHPQLLAVEYGRLVDVYGLQQSGGGLTLVPFRKDVMVGADIQDERDNRVPRADHEILYDFIGSDPDTLQPRLLITREVGTEGFNEALEKLDHQLRLTTPMSFGQGGPGHPYSVVPRNAAIRLTFGTNLGIGDDFFVVRDPQGRVTGLRNTQAVQLLEIAGDPNGPNAATAFRPLPVRVIVSGNHLILDPVLLGSEGIQYETRNNASGLPESPDSIGANIRVAIALEGPLAIPGLRADEAASLSGKNNSGLTSIVRDFRSGNATDNWGDLSRGFVRDPIPPRIVGEIAMYLERVDQVSESLLEITVFKNGVVHEIDRGDVFKFVADNSGLVMGTAEVVVDPQDDQGLPAEQHVRVRVRYLPGLQAIDPRRLPGYPEDLQQRESWLVINAPKAVLVAEFAAGGRIDPVTSQVIADDPRYFITFSPGPLPDAQGNPGQPDQNVSPFAGAVVRFTKPVDLATVLPADTFFFGLRNLLDQASIDSFINSRPNGSPTPGMDATAFNVAKYRTPHLVGARVFDEDGSQTTLRLQPTLGFHLDDRMRAPLPTDDFRYFVHLLSGTGGVRDLSDNSVDLQADVPTRGTHVVFPFTVDARGNGTRNNFDNNLVVYLVRRFADRDEDENPSYYLPNEVPPPPGVQTGPSAEAQVLDDLFGSFAVVDGTLHARPTSRLRRIADNLNQSSPPDQGSVLRYCPVTLSGQPQQATGTAGSPFGAGIQNPLNPYGCRLQTAWREIDLSLSRVDPFEFDLDVEQMYWAPFLGTNIHWDEFDRLSLYVGHSERRPEPCIATGTFPLPSFPSSGLETTFRNNYVHNVRAQSTTWENEPQPHVAFADAPMAVDSSLSVLEPNRINRFLPLPRFRQPYFVWRDQRVTEQGAICGLGSDIRATANDIFTPYIISPWLSGQGRKVVQNGTALQYRDGFWHNGRNFLLANTTSADNFTDGLVGSVALPLLADFWTWCDTASLPAGNGYVALGTNGWQLSITVPTSPPPNFRVYSAGRAPLGASGSVCLGTSDPGWAVARGGYTPSGGTTIPGDNSFYWIMVDFLKRQSVITSGFVDLYNPHRVAEGTADSRLGPFFTTGGQVNPPPGTLPVITQEFYPPLSRLPAGTSAVVEFRGASAVDPDPWYWRQWYSSTAGLGPAPQPTAANFALDPYKAGDAHIRKYDDRSGASTPARNWWTYFYNRTVTRYVEDPNTVLSPTFTNEYRSPNEAFTPRDVRYLNWRFVMTNNVGATPPVAPSLDTFTLAWRYSR